MSQDAASGQTEDVYEPVTHEGDQREEGRDDAPNPETGVCVGMGDEPTSFEPEEDPDAAASGPNPDEAESPA